MSFLSIIFPVGLFGVHRNIIFVLSVIWFKTLSTSNLKSFSLSNFAYFIFDDYWFEKSLIEFGNSTGVVASGLLLLRLADPKNISKTLPIFTSKQLFAQLILSGGFFTVIAPLVISKIGLDYWTDICALITFLIFISAFLFNKNISTSIQ